MNRDPIGFSGGLNLFEYSRNNPITFTDHTGLEPWAASGIGPLGLYTLSPAGYDRDYLSGLSENIKSGNVVDHNLGSGAHGHAQDASLSIFPHPGIRAINSAMNYDPLNPGPISGPRLTRNDSGSVYRNLSESDDPCKGISARAPGVDASPIQHVAGLRKSPWISTSKTSGAAMNFVKKGFHGQVKIDLSKVTTEVVDVSTGPFGIKAKMLNAFARKGKEVLIRDFIPADAIQWHIKP